MVVCCWFIVCRLSFVSVRGGSGGKNPEPKGAADLALPALGTSPPAELEEPPEGHRGRDDNRAGGAGAEVGSMLSSSSGRRRFYKSRSAMGGSNRNVSGRDGRGEGSGGARTGASPEDPLDSSGGGGGGGSGSGARLKRASSYSKFARKKSGKALDVDYDDHVAFWSGSELARGGGDEGRRQPSPASAAASARRDRSAPPSGRVPSGIGRYPLVPAEPAVGAVGAVPPRGGTGGEAGGLSATAGNHQGRGGATKPTTATSPADVRMFPDDDDVGEDSTRGLHRQGSAPDSMLEMGGIANLDGTARPRRKTTRRVVDGYTSAPEVCSDNTAARGAALEIGECIARAEAALFAADTTSDAEIGGDCDHDQASLSSDGDGEAALCSRGRRNKTAAASAAAAPALTAGGRHATTSKRRRFSELLHFRRRISSGADSPGAFPPSASATNGDGGVGTGGTDDGGILRDSNSSASSGTALRAATTGGKTGLRRGSTASSAHPRRSMLYRANSTSALDRVGSDRGEDLDEEEEEEEDSAAPAAGGKPATSGRRRAGARRRLLPGGGSFSTPSAHPSAGRGVSVSPERHRHRHRRHRESLLEAGKDKFRRGRSKLSRGAFGARSAQRQVRAVAGPGDGDGDASREVSPSGGNASGEVEEDYNMGEGPAVGIDGSSRRVLQQQPTKQGGCVR